MESKQKRFNKDFKQRANKKNNNNQRRSNKNNSVKNISKYSKEDILRGVAIEALPIRNKQKKSNQSKRIKNIPKEALPDIEKPKFESDAIPKDIKEPLVALFDEEKKESIDFDEALENLKKTEELKKGEEIVYIGKGEFAVIAYVAKPSKNKRELKKVLEIRRKITFESHREDLEWRDELCFGLSLSYKPNPDPLSQMYTKEEEESFTRYN